MIVHGQTILSDDIAGSYFVCDLKKCKGGCCVEGGEMGAPLDITELPVLDRLYPDIKPYISPEGIAEIERQGKYIEDADGEYSTPTIKGAMCAYGYYEGDTVKCGIEKAWKEGKIDFQKPVSCHLYPIRVQKYEGYEALNYHRWDICGPACSLGSSLKVPLFVFLKDALIRNYGQGWYDELTSLLTTGKGEWFGEQGPQ